MAAVTEKIDAFRTTAIEAAIETAHASLDTAARLIALNFQASKAFLDETSNQLHALAAAKDPEQIEEVRSRIAASSLDATVGYSRGICELMAGMQAEFALLMEARIAALQKNLTDGLHEVAKSAPPGSGVAVAALKTHVAAATAALDNVTSAAKQFSSLAGTQRASARKRK
jgi:phasin family protein